jgi:hypothetical protein
MRVLIHSQLATSSLIRPLSNSVARLNWSIASLSCLMVVSLSIVLLEDYYSNDIEVLRSRMGFRSIRKNSGMGGYGGELNTYNSCYATVESKYRSKLLLMFIRVVHSIPRSTDAVSGANGGLNR